MTLKYTPYHIHIGAHDVYPSLLETVANEFAEELRNTSTHLVSAADFRTKVRPALTEASGGPQHVSELGLSRGNERVVMSAHGILCSKSAVLTKRGLYAESERALSRLQRFFSGEDVSIHLITPPQHDYAAVADTVKDPVPPVSWLPIINQLAATFPQGEITIWPIEKRDVDAVEFCGAVLNLKFDPAQRKRVARLGREQRFPSTNFSASDVVHTEHAMLSAHLDHVFLEDISSVMTSGTVRVGLKRVRDEFSVS